MNEGRGQKAEGSISGRFRLTTNRTKALAACAPKLCLAGALNPKSKKEEDNLNLLHSLEAVAIRKANVGALHAHALKLLPSKAEALVI